MTEEKKEELTEIESLEEQGLVMRNLKTKDLPKMMNVIKKANAKEFVERAMTVFNNDVSKESIQEIETIRNEYNEKMEGKTEKEIEELEEQRDREMNIILNKEQNKAFTELATSAFNTVIENYDNVYDELNIFIANLYDIKKKEVEELDLDIFINCLYNLKNQDKLVNFLKTVLKQTQ